MRKPFKRSLLVLGLLVACAAILSVVGVTLFRGTPDWYGGGGGGNAPAPTAAQREEFARAAENKLVAAQNWAAELHAGNVRANRAAVAAGGTAATAAGAGSTSAPATKPGGHTTTAAAAADAHLIEFSQEELNSLFDKWSVLYGWREKYSEVLEEPRVVLRDGRLILAGRLRELGGAVASFQFQPAVDADGRLRMDLVRVTGGKLPLPDAAWTKWRDQVVTSLRGNLPAWRSGARIDPAGAANSSLMAATMSQLVLNTAERRASEPVVFLPLAGRGQAVPVRVADIAVAEGKLTMVVEPLTAPQRAELVSRVRAPQAAGARASGE